MITDENLYSGVLGGAELNQLHAPDTTEQTLVSECPAGSAFQVTFKFVRCHFLLKRSIEDQFPRQIFPGVSRMAAIMLIHAVA